MGQVSPKRIGIGTAIGGGIALITIVGLIYLTPKELHQISSQAEAAYQYTVENRDLPYRVDRLEKDVCILQSLPEKVTTLAVKQQAILENQRDQDKKLDEILRRLPK